MALWPVCVRSIFFGAPALYFSTLLEETETNTIHLHKGSRNPSRCTPGALGSQRVKWT